MSAGAAPSFRRPTGGYFRLPVSIVENQAALTRAELGLALIVVRRQNGEQAPVPVSDTNWQNWTGLSPRQKEYAIAGLKVKGLQIHGHGDKARFRFDSDQWSSYVRSVERTTSRARTTGRGVDPKHGAKVHPQCRERGCALLNAERQSGLSLVTSTEVAQPVAQNETDNTCVIPGENESVSPPGQTKLIPLVPTPVAQPVAQNEDPGDWKLTMSAITDIFPLAGIAFLLRLLTAVFVLFRNVTDTELAQAVGLAWRMKHKVQKTEGLFLLTVPEALKTLRKARSGPSPVDDGPDYWTRARDVLERVTAAVAGRGAPFAGYLERLEALKARVAAEGESSRDAVSLISLDSDFEKLEAELAQTAREVLPEALRATVAACVEGSLRAAGRSINRVALERVREQLTGTESLKALGIPRLTMFYA